MPENTAMDIGSFVTASYDEEEQRQQNEEYISDTINDFGDSGVQNELMVLESQYQRSDNSGSYEIVLDSARQLLGSLDDTVDMENFPEKYGALMMKYSRLIGACESYLNSHSGFRFTSAGRGRVSSIKKMMQNAMREVLLLQTAGAASAAASETPKTWREIMFGRNAAVRNEWARGAEDRPDFSAYRSDYTSIMSSESFRQMCGRRMDETEQRVYDLLVNIDKSKDPEFAAASGYLDQILREIGPNPRKSALQLLKNQCEQRMMQSDTSGVSQNAVEQATAFARQSKEGAALRDRLLSEMSPEEIPENYIGSEANSRVVLRMDLGDEETSRRRLQNEMAYYSGKNDPGKYEAIKSGVADELRALTKFRLLDMSEGEIMENYSEILSLSMSAMHLVDIGKITNKEGNTLKSEIWSESGVTDEMVSCINQILWACQFIGRALWSLRSLDLGWVPTRDDLVELDKKHMDEFSEDGVIDPEKYRSYLQKSILEKYRGNLAFYRDRYKDIIPTIMAMGA